MRHLLYYTIFSISLLLCHHQSAAQEWQQIGNIGLSRHPYALYNDTVNYKLYIAGNFMYADADTVYGICSWDGSNFAPLDGGNWYTPLGPHALNINDVIRYENSIVIGSSYDIGIEQISGIAAFDGNVWHPFGIPDSTSLISEQSGPNCYHLYNRNDTLYAGGAFWQAGQDTCNSIAMWDGTAWHALGFPGEYMGSITKVFSITHYKNELYVAGNFRNMIDGQINMDILRYDGSQWKMVGPGMLGSMSIVSDMRIYKDELYVCGQFSGSAGNVGNKIMRWNGETWRDVGGGLCSPGFATKMMVHNDKLYVVGIFDCMGKGLPASNIGIWDGEYWCSLGNSYFNNKISCIGVYNNEIYVGGGFTEVGGYPISYLAKYIGDNSTDSCLAPISSVQGQAPHKGVLTASIQPNPASSNTQVIISGADGAVSYQCFDITGRIVLSGSFEQQGGALELSNLPEAVYYLQLMDERGQFITLRVVKG
jgi:trimeric autotransporter adhesin